LTASSRLEACSPASEASSSASSAPGGSRHDGNARSTLMLEGYLPSTGPASRSTKTLKRSTKRSSRKASKCYAEGSLASLSAQPESDEESPMIDTYGPNLFESFAMFGPDGSLLKTCQGCSQSTLDGSSEQFSEPWPRAGMMRNGILYRRHPSGLAIDAIESSLSGTYPIREIVPTPSVADAKGRKYQYAHGDHNQKTLCLPGYVVMFPTPRGGTEGVGMCEGTGAFNQLDRLLEDGIITPSECSAMKAGNGGTLNPNWVEWLMGFPPGWTDLLESAMLLCPMLQSTSDGRLSSMKEV